MRLFVRSQNRPAVAGDLDAMNRVAELSGRIGRGIVGPELLVVGGYHRHPNPLERPGLGVEHDDRWL